MKLQELENLWKSVLICGQITGQISVKTTEICNKCLITLELMPTYALINA